MSDYLKGRERDKTLLFSYSGYVQHHKYPLDPSKGNITHTTVIIIVGHLFGNFFGENKKIKHDPVSPIYGLYSSLLPGKQPPSPVLRAE